MFQYYINVLANDLSSLCWSPFGCLYHHLVVIFFVWILLSSAEGVTFFWLSLFDSLTTDWLQCQMIRVPPPPWSPHLPKTILGTTVKLNDFNYLLCVQIFRIFIDAQNKLTHLLEPPRATTDITYEIGSLVTIVWWLGSSTAWRKRTVVVSCSCLLRRRCKIP